MKKSEQVIELLNGLSDRQFELTLDAIQVLRKHERDNKSTVRESRREEPAVKEPDKYWKSRSVIVAIVKGVTAPKDGETTSSLSLAPKLTLAGNFDAGKTPGVAAAIDTVRLPQDVKRKSGQEVIIVLQRDGESYRVSREVAEYMPERDGVRTSIFVLKDLADPALRKTIDALHARREAERKAQERRKVNTLGAEMIVID